MDLRYEELVKKEERLKMVTEYVERCMNDKYQVIDKPMLCWLLGIEYKERGYEE